MHSLRAKMMKAKKQSKMAGSFIEEIKKVEWTKKTDLKNYVKIVLTSIFCFGFSIYFVDLVIRKLLVFLSSVTRFLFG